METFTFMAGVWDVGLAKQIAAKKNPIMVDPRQQGKMLGMDEEGKLHGMIRVNETYAKAMTPEQLDEPVIVVMLPSDSGYLLIDGWHRTYRAMIDKTHRIKAVILDPKEEVRVRVRPKPWPKMK